MAEGHGAVAILSKTWCCLQRMVVIEDYFFGPYVTPQEWRLRYVAKNGVQHASEIRPRDPQPGDAVTLCITTDAALPISQVAVYYTTDGSEPVGAWGVAERGAVVRAKAGAATDGALGGTRVRRWEAILPGQPDGTLVRYRIDAWSEADPARCWVADAQDYLATPIPAGREFSYHVDRRQPPGWLQDAIIYQIFVDRFAAAHDQPPIRDPGSITDFYGGTLRGITEKLDYLADLGVNCLWLSPVMASPTYHGYDFTSYSDVEPRLGTNADLRELITQAHARNIRVLLDFVANHTSHAHPAFVASQHDASVPEAAWYTFDPTYHNGYLSYYQVSSMPVLATDRPAVREFLVAAARAWLSEFGADGLRLDHASGPTHAFWTFFQERIKEVAPDALTLGEVTGGMTDIVTFSGRLDAVMDFPLAKVTRQTFAQRTLALADLLQYLERHMAEFPATLGQVHLLDNHDMYRFAWLAENDTRRLMLALVFLLALPGAAVIYYGTEVGLSQRQGPSGKDAYAREPMPWDGIQQNALHAHTRWLLRMRQQRAELRRGQMHRLVVACEAGAPEHLGALVRWEGANATVIIMNNSLTPANWRIAAADLPAPLAGLAPKYAWLSAVEGIQDVTPTLAGTLPALSACVLQW
jgi:cyclomaltodextrinase